MDLKSKLLDPARTVLLYGTTPPRLGTAPAEVEALRERGEPTVPTTIALELATNPFMRAGSVEELAARRAGKDSFRG